MTYAQSELKNPGPEAVLVAVQGLRHLHAEQVKTNQLLAEILEALKSAPKTAQTPQMKHATQSAPATRQSVEAKAVSGVLGRDAKLDASGKMVRFSIEELDGLNLRFIKVKATKDLDTAKNLRSGDRVRIEYSEVKQEPNYKDPSKMDSFIWLSSLKVLQSAPPPPPPDYAEGYENAQPGAAPAPGGDDDDIPF